MSTPIQFDLTYNGINDNFDACLMGYEFLDGSATPIPASVFQMDMSAVKKMVKRYEVGEKWIAMAILLQADPRKTWKSFYIKEDKMIAKRDGDMTHDYHISEGQIDELIESVRAQNDEQCLSSLRRFNEIFQKKVTEPGVKLPTGEVKDGVSVTAPLSEKSKEKVKCISKVFGLECDDTCCKKEPASFVPLCPTPMYQKFANAAKYQTREEPQTVTVKPAQPSIMEDSITFHYEDGSSDTHAYQTAGVKRGSSLTCYLPTLDALECLDENGKPYLLYTVKGELYRIDARTVEYILGTIDYYRSD